MSNKIRFLSKWFVFVLCIVALLAMACSASAESAFSTEKVSKISVSVKPAQMVYVIGDTFSPEGGVLTVTYKDKTTAEVPMTDPGVTFSSTSLSAEGSKSIKVEFGGKSTRISVTVSASGYTVTYDPNYDGAPAADTLSVAGGATAEAKAPVREGYTLEGWYTDKDYRVKFDFATPIEDDTTLYAFWKDNSAAYVDVTFDYHYYGVKLSSYTRPVKQGAAVEKPADPTRVGYTFDGWYTDATYAQAYDFTAPVNGSMTLVAKWAKAVEGVQTYVFEAEDTDLTGKEGVGSSGVSTERSMIQFDANGDLHPSNGRWVGYQYKKGLTLDFYFASDAAVNDATISISVSTELPGSYTYDMSNYSILLNGIALNYRAFTMELPADAGLDAKTPFTSYVVASGAALQEGENTLVLMVNNNTTIQGTTYQSVGPMVDAVIIETSAVLTWDETKGLPADNY